jgi:integrase
MATELLSAREVATKAKPGLYGDGDNLFLKVTPSGTKSWVFRYSVPAPDKGEGKRRRHAIGLGRYPRVSLADARSKAEIYGKTLENYREGLAELDPAAAKRAKAAERRLLVAKAMTFRQCAEAYIGAHQAGWRNAKHGAQWGATLDAYVYPVFGKLAVAGVDVGLVLKAIEPIWTTKPETASRVRGRIESILDWAKARGYRDGENPARWRGHLDHLLPKKSKVATVARAAKGRSEHHAALPYVEIAGFMAALREQEGVAARALEFAILTATRTGEVIGARWDEVSLVDRLWTIPGERMKAGKEHRVPLSDAAVAILKALPRKGAYVFAGAREGSPLSNMALLMTLRRMERGELTTHGFRSTFRDWAAERTSFPAEVAEMALAHAVGDKVEAAYRRGDLFEKRRQLADAWAKFCTQPAPAGDNVRPIRAAS